jgi:hypothetical protein
MKGSTNVVSNTKEPLLVAGVLLFLAEGEDLAEEAEGAEGEKSFLLSD